MVVETSLRHVSNSPDFIAWQNFKFNLLNLTCLNPCHLLRWIGRYIRSILTVARLLVPLTCSVSVNCQFILLGYTDKSFRRPAFHFEGHLDDSQLSGGLRSRLQGARIKTKNLDPSSQYSMHDSIWLVRWIPNRKISTWIWWFLAWPSCQRMFYIFWDWGFYIDLCLPQNLCRRISKSLCDRKMCSALLKPHYRLACCEAIDSSDRFCANVTS